MDEQEIGYITIWKESKVYNDVRNTISSLNISMSYLRASAGFVTLIDIAA